MNYHVNFFLLTCAYCAYEIILNTIRIVRHGNINNTTVYFLRIIIALAGQAAAIIFLIGEWDQGIIPFTQIGIFGVLILAERFLILFEDVVFKPRDFKDEIFKTRILSDREKTEFLNAAEKKLNAKSLSKCAKCEAALADDNQYYLFSSRELAVKSPMLNPGTKRTLYGILEIAKTVLGICPVCDKRERMKGVRQLVIGGIIFLIDCALIFGLIIMRWQRQDPATPSESIYIIIALGFLLASVVTAPLLLMYGFPNLVSRVHRFKKMPLFKQASAKNLTIAAEKQYQKLVNKNKLVFRHDVYIARFD